MKISQIIWSYAQTCQYLKSRYAYSSSSTCRTFIPVDFAFILDSYNMILDEKWCSGNTLQLAFNCRWKFGIFCWTTASCFSRTAMQHLQQLVFENRPFCHMFIASCSLKLWYPKVLFETSRYNTLLKLLFFSGFKNLWTWSFVEPRIARNASFQYLY